MDRLRSQVREAGDADVSVITYESVRRRATLPAGAYVFSDLERLNAYQRLEAEALYTRIKEAAPAAVILNNPYRVLRRYGLLRRLHQAGVNEFNTYRVDEVRWPATYPVFLREECEHNGHLTSLLHSREELEAAISALGVPRPDRLIVEYVDMRDSSGVYRKFGAMGVGGTVLARNFYSSKHWVIKDRGDVECDQVGHISTNPHAAILAPMLRLANIDYGRIDYGFTPAGRLQVFEINTNPLVTAVSDPDPGVESLWKALSEIDTGHGADVPLAGLPGRRPRRWQRIVRGIARRAGVLTP